MSRRFTLPYHDQRSSRPKHDFQNNTDQLRDMINNQMQMLQPDWFNVTERLYKLVDKQYEWLGMSINDGEQIGMGPSNDDASGYDSSAPHVGLSQYFIDRLIREGGCVVPKKWGQFYKKL